MPQSVQEKDLLIEIGMEELPPENLKGLSDQFKTAIMQGLISVDLSFESVEAFVAPRRLALRINGLSSTQPNQTLLKKGPAVAAAFDKDGKPTQAALGFAASCKTTVDALTTQQTDKGSFLAFEQNTAGQSVSDLLPGILQNVIHSLPLTKRMRWGAQQHSFIRPLHWLLVLFGNTVIPCELFGITSGDATRGHRFHHPAFLPIASPKAYESTLFEKGKVIACLEDRQKKIEGLLQAAARKAHGHLEADADLLDLVTGLVDWPVVLIGQFDPLFLDLPPEALISAMKVHQKSFPLYDEKAKLLPKFLIVSNIESTDPTAVISGNEAVMRARLDDAVFYYKTDQKTDLRSRQEKLKQVVFQHNLGSLYDKSLRIQKLSSEIAKTLKVDPAICERAALLCKADLLTHMVEEFPELQGIMGRYYALNDGESDLVAQAIEEHYRPRFAQDRLPITLEGTILALSDRIDTLMGIFGIGKRPTGDKDPFALRRQALAVLRIIIQQEQDLDLNEVFLQAQKGYGDLLKPDPENAHIQLLLEFCFERLRGWYAEQSIPARVFDAVLTKRPTKPLDFHKRILAVNEFQKLPEADSLSAANKRVRNILIKNEIDTSLNTNIDQIDQALLIEPAEKSLAHLILEQEKILLPLIKIGNYNDALQSLARLKVPIDHFFDSVMVMADDLSLRRNRLTLLHRLQALFLEIADISVL